MLRGKKIVIGITGSIAAFKIPYLIRLLIREGAEVKVLMTPSAADFVTPLTLSTLSGNPVLIDPFDPVNGSWNSHVELGMWADLLLIAPATANTLAKMAHGIADNLLLTSYLSAKCPVFFAPAMDLDMYKHPTTLQNIRTLQSYGNYLIEPAIGELASGLIGAGRMEDPENIILFIKDYFEKNDFFKGKKVLITAGPTHEAIDPVRYIGNYSSGLMGFEIANEFASRGAEVILVTGPTHLVTRQPAIRRIDVVTAQEMQRNCERFFKSSDITVMAAAVADFKPSMKEQAKLKKVPGDFSIHLEYTADILKGLGKLKKKNQILVGFALETEDEEKHAKAKLKDKNLDLIILNSLKDPGAGFGTQTNKIRIFSKSGQSWKYPLKPKADVARDIVDKIQSII
jgi:phosphopantothenoylcysteine decarboxylase/phosphopantothenate--cysteine ligase